MVVWSLVSCLGVVAYVGRIDRRDGSRVGGKRRVFDQIRREMAV